MRRISTASGIWKQPWLWFGVALAVGVVLGGLAGLALAPSPAPQRTFTVVAYHWGFALYDEDGTEVPQIEVTRGTEVTLLVISAAALGHEAHEAFMARTIGAWADNPAFGSKNATELADLMEEAETQGLLDHAVRIPEFGVSVITDHESPAPARVTFMANQQGTFDILCGQFCGWGHAYMSLEGGLVVS